MFWNGAAVSVGMTQRSVLPLLFTAKVAHVERFEVASSGFTCLTFKRAKRVNVSDARRDRR